MCIMLCSSCLFTACAGQPSFWCVHKENSVSWAQLGHARSFASGKSTSMQPAGNTFREPHPHVLHAANGRQAASADARVAATTTGKMSAKDLRDAHAPQAQATTHNGNMQTAPRELAESNAGDTNPSLPAAPLPSSDNARTSNVARYLSTSGASPASRVRPPSLLPVAHASKGQKARGSDFSALDEEQEAAHTALARQAAEAAQIEKEEQALSPFLRAYQHALRRLSVQPCTSPQAPADDRANLEQGTAEAAASWNARCAAVQTADPNNMAVQAEVEDLSRAHPPAAIGCPEDTAAQRIAGFAVHEHLEPLKEYPPMPAPATAASPRRPLPPLPSPEQRAKLAMSNSTAAHRRPPVPRTTSIQSNGGMRSAAPANGASWPYKRASARSSPDADGGSGHCKVCGLPDVSAGNGFCRYACHSLVCAVV